MTIGEKDLFLLGREFRFWMTIEIGEENQCWNWLGTKTKAGYGAVNFLRNRTTSHRIAFLLAGGALGPSDVVMHVCDNPSCCNPRHLLAGTQKQNLDDMRQKHREGDCRNFGERHGRSKVTSSQVAEIKSVYAAGNVSQAEVGQLFGLSQNQVSRIIRGESRLFG